VANDKLDIVHSDDKAAWDSFVGKVNDSLDSLDLEFRHLNDEVTGREMYALVKPFSFFPMPHVNLIARPCQVNRRGDDIAQMATDYSAVEIAYFKAIVSPGLWHHFLTHGVILQ
jgi:hypothetical protein